MSSLQMSGNFRFASGCGQFIGGCLYTLSIKGMALNFLHHCKGITIMHATLILVFPSWYCVWVHNSVLVVIATYIHVLFSWPGNSWLSKTKVHNYPGNSIRKATYYHGECSYKIFHSLNTFTPARSAFQISYEHVMVNHWAIKWQDGTHVGILISEHRYVTSRATATLILDSNKIFIPRYSS